MASRRHREPGGPAAAVLGALAAMPGFLVAVAERPTAPPPAREPGT